MSEAEERILTVELEEELSGRTAPDLTMRILVAARETGLRALERRRRPIRRFAIAAACLAIAAIGISAWLLSSGPTRGATSPERLLALGPEMAGRWDVRFVAGDFVLTGGDAGALEFDGGTRVSLASRTMIRLVRTGEEPTIQLYSGAVRVHPPAATVFSVSSSLGVARVHGGSDVEIEITTDPWMTDDEFRALAVSWAGGAPPPTRSLLIAVARGSGDVDGIVAGEGRLLAVERDATAALSDLPSPGDRVVLDRLIRNIRVGAIDVDPNLPNAFQLRKRGSNSARDLKARLMVAPELWGYVLPRLTLLPGEQRQDVRARLIDLLIEDPELRARRLLGELLRTDAASFDADSLLRLAEREFGPARTEIAARFPGSQGDPRILFAAYFAMRGDPRGVADLEEVLRREEWRVRRPNIYFACASALTVLGDDTAWNHTIRWLSDEVERRLAAGMLPYARWLSLSASYFRRVVDSGGPVGLAHLGYAVTDWETRMQDTVQTAEQIRALLRRLAK